MRRERIRAFSPQNYTGEEKGKLLITRLIHYVFKSLLPPHKFVCLPHGYQIKAMSLEWPPQHTVHTEFQANRRRGSTGCDIHTRHAQARHAGLACLT